MELVTVKSFDSHIEAHLVKSKLESEGIVCFLFDENMVSINPLYSIMVGGIKLKVADTDLEEALMIMDIVQQTAIVNEAGEAIKCPQCGSVDIQSGYKSVKGTKGVLSFLVAFVLTIFPFYYKIVNKCNSCGHEFGPNETT